MPSVRSFTVLPALPESIKELDFLARNMFWCWNLDIVVLFKRVDSKLWKACGYNPIKLLGSVSQERLDYLSKNQGFLCELNRAVEKLNSYLSSTKWFEKNGVGDSNSVIAYFSAEFGIHECLPIYAGGLGILAGDHLKSASDLGIPLVGVGLLYQKGYFRQYLNVDGWQQEIYVDNDFYNMPVKLLEKDDGDPVTISVEYPGRNVEAQVWSVDVGRVKLYLLDCNIETNSPQDRMITANLYGGDNEMRICQELMLGVGGLRALKALGIGPNVCHMNEGHAAFMAIERIRQLKETEKLSFNEALEATRSGNVFTTHTPVTAGNDEFPVELARKYLEVYSSMLDVSEKDFLALGRVNPNNNDGPFKMSVLAMKLSSYRNGVSKLHGEVTRKMWALIWPEVPAQEVPIDHVTNGVHIKSWLSEELNSLYERYLGPDWSDGSVGKQIWENIDLIPDEELWRTHQRAKEQLIAFARSKLKTQIQRRGTYHTELNWAEEVLDPEALTIGFARRFATYKRGNLLLKDPKRLIKLLNNTKKPVQIIFAGKAHPRDTQGKEIIRQIIHFANQYDVRRRIVFLEDYDINVARFMVRGVDIWLNNPRPPMEASGTSGMKAAFNGAINMSTLDGWWCEAYKPEAGWAIGSGENYEDTAYQDVVESQAIYNILEKEAVPLYYSRSADNLPRAWIQRMKNTIKIVTPCFNTNRMVMDYTNQFYMPAAEKWKYLATEDMTRAKAFAAWKSNMKKNWAELEIKDVQVQVKNGQEDAPVDLQKTQLKVGFRLSVNALIKLGGIDPDDVRVELYHGPVDSWGNISEGVSVEMEHKSNGQSGGEHVFAGLMSCEFSGRQGMAVRVLPKHADMVNPYDLSLILWESNTTAGRNN